jgi:hypothetical protein
VSAPQQPGQNENDSITITATTIVLLEGRLHKGNSVTAITTAATRSDQQQQQDEEKANSGGGGYGDDHD